MCVCRNPSAQASYLPLYRPQRALKTSPVKGIITYKGRLWTTQEKVMLPLLVSHIGLVKGSDSRQPALGRSSSPPCRIYTRRFTVLKHSEEHSSAPWRAFTLGRAVVTVAVQNILIIPH